MNNDYTNNHANVEAVSLQGLISDKKKDRKNTTEEGRISLLSTWKELGEKNEGGQ